MKRKTLKEKFKNWPIKTKLMYSFGFIIVTTFLLIVSLLVGMKVIEKRLVKLYEGPTRNINYSAELYYPQLDIQRAVNKMLVEGIDKKDESYKELEDTVNKNLAIMNDSYSFLSGNLITQVDRDRLEAINNKQNNEVSKYRAEVMRLLKAGDFEGAKEYNNKYYMPAVNETKAMIEELEVSVMETAVDYKNEAAFIGNLFIIIGVILLVLITLGAVSVARVIISAIMDPVKQIEAATKGLDTSLPHTSILVNLFKEEKPQICLMGATVIGRDLGPRVSSALTSGLTADCTQLEIGTHEDKKNGITYENLLYQIRPAFGGNIVATIVNPEHRPQMATVREGVMKKEILDESYQGEVVNHDVAKFVPETDYVVKVIDRHVEKAKHNLKGAPIVIAGGYGMGSKEGFDKLFELAKELHAEVGASRAAVDAGYADHDRQIGQTGVTVRPKLYIACGISGQIQHIAGMQDAGIIISVNSDPNAPINTIADYVINGTVEEVVPKLIKYYKKNSK